MAYVESRLRALERRFVRARAELAVYQFVDAVMVHWDEYVRYCAQNESHTASLELYHKLWPGTVQVPTWLSAISYLEERRLKGEVPDPRHLTTRLAPWTARIRPVTWPAVKPKALPTTRSYRARRGMRTEPVLSKVEGSEKTDSKIVRAEPVLSTVEGLVEAQCFAETTGPVLSEVEGPVLSPDEAPTQSARAEPVEVCTDDPPQHPYMVYS